MVMPTLPRRSILCALSLALVLALTAAATPAFAKKAAGKDTSDNGGLFQPPTPLAKPTLVLDTVAPKIEAQPVTAQPVIAVRASAEDMAKPAAPAQELKPADPVRTIDSLRLHGLFE